MAYITLPRLRSFPAQRLAYTAVGQLRLARDVVTERVNEIDADGGVRRCAAFIVTLDAGRTVADAFFHQLSPRAMALQFAAGLAGMLAGAAGVNIIRRQASPKTSPNGVEALAAVGGAEFAMQATSRLLLG